jgi:sec-independent protein translocase protein TatB
VFDLSPEKILILGIIALVVLGPDRLPQAARRAGAFVAQVKQMSGGLQQEMRSALAEPRQVLDDARQELGLAGVPRVPNVRRAVLDTLTGTVETSSRVPSSSGVPDDAELSGGLPPPPDDPSLN